MIVCAKKRSSKFRTFLEPKKWSRQFPNVGWSIVKESTYRDFFLLIGDSSVITGLLCVCVCMWSERWNPERLKPTKMGYKKEVRGLKRDKETDIWRRGEVCSQEQPVGDVTVLHNSLSPICSTNRGLFVWNLLKDSLNPKCFLDASCLL